MFYYSTAVPGRPGFRRIDKVREGGFDGLKGAHPTHAVDEASKSQVKAATPRVWEWRMV